MDMHHDVEQEKALSITSISTNTTTNGDTIDMQGYKSIEFVLLSGTIADGSYAVTVQEGDLADGSDMANVASDLVLGSADFAAADDNVAKRIGSLGKKRYQRITITSTSVTTGGTLSAIAVLGFPSSAPVAD